MSSPHKFSSTTTNIPVPAFTPHVQELPQPHILTSEIKDSIKKQNNNCMIEQQDIFSDQDEFDSNNQEQNDLRNKNKINSTDELCLKGIGKFTKEKQIRNEIQQLLGDRMIKISQINKPKMKPFCFLTFDSEQDKLNFKKLLDEVQQGKHRLRVGDVNRNIQKYERKKQNQNSIVQQNIQVQVKPKLNFQFSLEEKIKQTAQLYNLSYDEQINYKYNELLKMLMKFRQSYIHKLHSDEQKPQWIQKSSEDIKYLAEIEEPIKCDEEFRYNYRNKSEFTIGYDSLDKIRVGFNIGSFQENNACVESIQECVVTPQISLQLAKYLEQYITKKFNEENLAPYNRSTGEGFWRIFVVRKSERTKQILLILSVNKNGGTQDQYLMIREEIILLLKNFNYDQYTLQGIVLLHSSQKVADYSDLPQDIEIIFGNPYYDEIILGKIFRISYNGFLQNHTQQCDKLYSKIIEFSKRCKPTLYQGSPVLLDVCAGSGTIGVCISDNVQNVIAIEMNKQSCEDASVNYKINSITNSRIICSKVEDVMKNLSNELSNVQKGSYFIACLDPPRAGVLPVVIDALRTCRGCDDIIYVSCSPSQVIDNLVQLCLPQSKRKRAPGFRIKSVALVDMFPQTNHYEVVFHLERDYLNL